MSFEQFATYREIKSQTEAWAQALDLTSAVSLPAAAAYDQVLFTGCGSTYYLSIAAAALYQELTGCSARAVPAGELVLNPGTVLTDQKTLLVAVSRSGTTSETLKAVENFRADGRGEVVAISNYDALLSQLADLSIVIDRGQEESIAQTRAFASMYIAASVLCARMAGRRDLVQWMARLPEAGHRVIADYEAPAQAIGENLDFDRFYFLGSGLRYGLACEANLKMKEMTLTHSEAFHFLEFRHGPMSMVEQKTVVIGMLADASRVLEAKVLSEMKALGGRVIGLGEKEAEIQFESGIPESVRGVLNLPVLQLMAFYRAAAKGLNPDRPNHLSAVVQLEL